MEQRSFLTKQIKILKEMRQLEATMGLQTFECFLRIAQNPNIGVSELARDLELTLASASRNVSYLSKWRKHQIEGYNLVEVNIDPLNNRHKLVKLSKEGEALVKKLTKYSGVK